MTQHQTDPVSRRTALAGLAAGGLGLALAATTHHASAQDATPTAMTGHPMVGTWLAGRTADSLGVTHWGPDGSMTNNGETISYCRAPVGGGPTFPGRGARLAPSILGDKAQAAVVGVEQPVVVPRFDDADWDASKEGIACQRGAVGVPMVSGAVDAKGRRDAGHAASSTAPVALRSARGRSTCRAKGTGA
jgi:hypothetical protein